MIDEKKELTTEEKTSRALIKKALGYVTKEIVEEFGEEDGEMVLKKKKVTSKSVPPDITAIKLVMDIKDEDDDFTKLSDEELEQEKIRLLKMLEESK